MLFAVFLFAVFSATVSPQAAYFTVRGQIILPGGRNFREPITVRLTGMNDEPVSKTTPGPSGHFEFYGIRSGSYYIHVDSSLLQDNPRSIEVPQHSASLTIRPEPAPFIVKRSFDDALGNSHTVDAGQLAADIPKKAIREYEKGLEAIRKNNLKKAVEHLERAVAEAPDYYNARHSLGSAYYKSSRYVDAKREFLRATKLNPLGSEPLIGLAEIFLREESWAEAVSVLERAIRLTPGSATAEYYLGSALYKLTDYTQAEEHLLRARLLNNDFSGVGLMLINVYVRQTRFKDALREVDRYIVQNPQSGELDDLQELKTKLMKDLAKQR